MSRHPAIWQAYSDTGALTVACPHCGAEQGMWCTTSYGRVARVPCVARIAAAAITIPAEQPQHRDSSEPTRAPQDEQ